MQHLPYILIFTFYKTHKRWGWCELQASAGMDCATCCCNKPRYSVFQFYLTGVNFDFFFYNWANPYRACFLNIDILYLAREPEFNLGLPNIDPVNCCMIFMFVLFSFFRLLELLLRLGADPNIGDEYSTYFAIAREQRFDPMSGNYTSVILEFIMVLSCIQFTFYLTFI